MTKPQKQTTNFIALLLEINQFRHNGNFQKCIILCQRAIIEYGETLELIKLLAGSYHMLALQTNLDEYFENAVFWYKKAIRMEPDNSLLYSDLGEVYSIGILDYKQANESYRMAMRLDQTNQKAFFGGASLYPNPDDLVSLAEAVRWVEHLTKINPDEPMYHLRLSNLYKLDGLVDDMRVEQIKALTCSAPLDEFLAKSIKHLDRPGCSPAAEP